MHQELSPREWDVAAEVAQGKTNKEIAVTTGLSPYTVKEYVANARRKTGSVNRAALGVWYVKHRSRRPR